MKRLIEKELIRQAVVRAHIKVDEAAVEAALSRYKRLFEATEVSQIVVIERQRLRDRAKLEGLLAFRGSLEVSDQEVAARYAERTRQNLTPRKTAEEIRHPLRKKKFWAQRSELLESLRAKAVIEVFVDFWANW